MVTRRHAIGSIMGITSSFLTPSARAKGMEVEAYEQAIRRIWRHTEGNLAEGQVLQNELIRYATLSPSSHNTQCWKFRIEDTAIAILPDLSRRCPVVDPDDHHLFASLGRATENLIHAAMANGWQGDAHFDSTGDGALRITFAPTTFATRQKVSFCR